MHRAPKILIVKLSAIGDVVHTLPALNAIRRQFPDAYISWLVEEAAADLLIAHPALDRVLVSRRKTWLRGFHSRDWRRHASDMLSFLRSLRDLHYDILFDFQAALKGAVLILLVRSRRKIGFDHGLEHQEFSHLFLNERIPAVSMEIHALERGLVLLKSIGISSPAVEYKLPLTPIHRKRADSLLAENGVNPNKMFAIINPMAKWKSKLWLDQRFGQLADRLQTELDLPVVFTGGAEDLSCIDSICSNMETDAIRLAGKTNLMTLAALLQRAKIMVTTDTGPMHIAAAVGTPTVALFGPTAPWRTGPYGKNHRIIRAQRSCSPCFKRKCPLAEICMETIEVEQVFKTIKDLLHNENCKDNDYIIK